MTPEEQALEELDRFVAESEEDSYTGSKAWQTVRSMDEPDSLADLFPGGTDAYRPPTATQVKRNRLVLLGILAGLSAVPVILAVLASNGIYVQPVYDFLALYWQTWMGSLAVMLAEVAAFVALMGTFLLYTFLSYPVRKRQK